MFRYAEFNDNVHFFGFWLEIHFLGKFGQKTKIVSLTYNLVPTIIFIIFWEFLMVEQTFLSPQVKRRAIVSNKLV